MIIVEDSKIVIEKLTKLLEPIENLEIMATADEADDAVKLIKEMRPEYVILDMSLKKGTGIRVLEDIQDMPDKPYIIVLSNLSYKFYKEKCQKLGARHFFDKAMEFEKVYDILHDLTAGKMEHNAAN